MSMNLSIPPTCIGLDIGDRYSHFVVLDRGTGEILEEGRVPTTRSGLERRFLGVPRARMALEVGGHRMLGPFGKESDLRRWGLALAGRGGKSAKKRAVISVARKLSVLLHHLCVTGEPYEPLRKRAGAQEVQTAWNTSRSLSRTPPTLRTATAQSG